MCEECDAAKYWGCSPIKHCDFCDVGVRVEKTGEIWAKLPEGWLVGPSEKRDEEERYACSKEHALAMDNAKPILDEYRQNVKGNGNYFAVLNGKEFMD